jgi:chitinase
MLFSIFNMRLYFLKMIILLTVSVLSAHVISVASTPENDFSISDDVDDMWVTAYLASWQHNAQTPYSNWGVVTSDEIDWDVITHLIYFALRIDPDGSIGLSLDPKERHNLNTDRINDIVSAAHKNDTKILFSVGGAGNYKGFSSAIKPENRDRFIHTISRMITQYGFDGVDLDMEPIRQKDFQNYREFVYYLHKALADIKTRNGDQPMITIAAVKGGSVSRLYASIQKYVDQINYMTYDMAQPWPGWQAWHNSALFSNGARFDKTGKEMSSIHQKVTQATTNGVKRNKIGIGIDFYGYIWKNVHLKGKWEKWPNQDLSIIERPGGVPYYELYERFNLENASWDSQAATSYLHTENPKTFVSFDNERSIRRKVRYAIEEKLGGVMLWELGGGYIEDNSTKWNPLLSAVKEEIMPVLAP